MKDFDRYHPQDRVFFSLLVLFGFGGLSILFLFILDVPSLLESTGNSLISKESMYLQLFWHFFCLVVGLSAIIYMFRMKTGHMIVRSHRKKADLIIHPLGIRKFVTFSSWTLILNVMYFGLAILVSLVDLTETEIPSWLNLLMAGSFVTALGASFLTSTVVKYVILPGDFADYEHHRRQFWFHNQVMHNFCTIFLVAEIIFMNPTLEISYMLFGIIIGLTYALFAYPFAVFGGGYYCYSFIDPRLHYAPFFIFGLASAISFSYAGVWVVSWLMSVNYIFGSLLIIFWCGSVVQFKPKKRSLGGGRAEPKTESK